MVYMIRFYRFMVLYGFVLSTYGLYGSFLSISGVMVFDQRLFFFVRRSLT